MGEIAARAGSGVPARDKPATKAQREIDRLIDQARQQPTAEQAVPLVVKAEGIARQAVGDRLKKMSGHLGDDPAGQTYLEVKDELVEAYSAAGKREAV